MRSRGRLLDKWLRERLFWFLVFIEILVKGCRENKENRVFRNMRKDYFF